MPKFSYRCNRRGQHLPPVVTVAFCAPPRKVSFEDGHSDSDDSSPSMSPVQGDRPTTNNGSSSSFAPKLPTLRRPKSSLSLVDMVRDAEDDEDSNKNNNRNEQNNFTDDKYANMMSPVATSRLDSMEISPLPLSPSSSSPWGYFVDMVIPLEDATPTNRELKHYIHHEGPCSCCSSCRRRRASPYGDYKKQRRASLCFKPQPAAAHDGGVRTIPLPSSIRLSPRKQFQQPQEPAEQLIGALDRLQVD